MLAFIAFEIAALILWVPGMWNERLSAFLAIIGMYGLAIAFISRSKGFKAMRNVMEDLTSSNIFRYMRGNCLFLSFLSFLIGDALSPGKVPGYPLWHFPIAVPLLFLVFLLFFPYAAFHLLVIAALAYIPMVLVSVFVDEFVYAGTEAVLKFRSESEYETVWISGMVRGNPAAVKGLLLGIPALSISFLSAIISPFIA